MFTHLLLNFGIVPIINENEDTVVTDEIKFGDNDTLGALVANLLGSQMRWIILTDQRGLYTAGPAQGRHRAVSCTKRGQRPGA